jgi:hypothetical protein
LACSGIDPGYPSLYTSGQNTLWATAEKANATDCANYCSGWYNHGLNATVYYPNTTCHCWTYGDLNTSPSAATAATSGNATFIDFYETGNLYGPPAAVKWGIFTCPEGAYHIWFVQQGVVYGACYPLTIHPGQAAMANCPSSGTYWEMREAVNGFDVISYSKFSPVKVFVNYSSPYTLVDIYDFTTHTSSSRATWTRKLTSMTTSKKPTTAKSASKMITTTLKRSIVITSTSKRTSTSKITTFE